jgi:hypothetical protein
MSSFLLGGSGAPSLKFTTPGDAHTLSLTEEPTLTQQTEFGTGELKYWKDGSPRMQLVCTGSVDESERDGADDDLTRRLYLRGESQKAVGAAVREAGVKTLEVGGVIWIKYTGDGQKGTGGFAPKLYTAKYKKPEPGQSAQASFLGDAKADGDSPPF